MSPLADHDREAFLAEPRIATICVTRPGTRPPSATPALYSYDPGGDLTFFTTGKNESIDKARVLTVSVHEDRPPYRYVTVECQVVDAARPPAPDALLAVLRRYLSWDDAQGVVA